MPFFCFMFSILCLAVMLLNPCAVDLWHSHVDTQRQDYEYESYKFNILPLNDSQYRHFQKLIAINKELGLNPQRQVFSESLSQDVNKICTQFGIPTTIEVFSDLFSGDYTMFSNSRKLNLKELQYFVNSITPHPGIKDIYIYPPNKVMIAYLPISIEGHEPSKLSLEKKRPYALLLIYAEKSGYIHLSEIYLYQGQLPPTLQKSELAQ